MNVIPKVLAGLGVLLLASCSSGPNNLNVIPKEAKVVSVIDFYSIIKKGKLYDIKDFNLFNVFTKEARKADKGLVKLSNEIIDDPGITGISLTSDFFVYYLNEAEDESFSVISAELNSDSKFEDFIKHVLKKTGGDLEIEDGSTYKYTIMGRDVAMAWDSDKVVFLTALNRASRPHMDIEIEALFELSESEQITSNEDFNTFYNKKKDISVWMSTNLYENSYQYKMLMQQADFDISDSYASAHLDFEDESVSLLTEFTPNEEVQKMMSEHNIFEHEMNTDLLEFFPSENLATASMSISPSAYYSLIKKQGEFEKVEAEFKRETGFEFKEIVESIEGSAVVSVFGFKEVEYTYETEGYGRSVEVSRNEYLPQIGLAFDINGNRVLKDMLDNMPEGAINKLNNYYQFTFDRKFPAYLAFNDKVCYISNDLESIAAFNNGGGSGDDLSDSDVSSAIESSNFYTYLNLNYESYPKEIKKRIKSSQNGMEKKLFKIWNEIAKSMELKSIETNSVEFIFNTKDSGSNSLSVIFKAIDENYQLFL